jgi:AcrR family transcriptional regulator
MVQVLKESVRNQIVEAAEVQFAKAGFTKATIGAIAREAGVAAGTVYKYFPNKTALFRSILTDAFVQEFSRLTRDRIVSFTRPEGLAVSRNQMEGESGKLLRFFASNRLKVIILLGWGENTEYEDFARSYIKEMESQTMSQVREQFPQLRITRTFRFMVKKMLVESVRGIVSILKEFEDEKSLHEAFSVAARCQLAGVNTLIQWALSGG